MSTPAFSPAPMRSPQRAQGRTAGCLADVSTRIKMAYIAGMFAIPPAFGAADAVVFEVAAADAGRSFLGAVPTGTADPVGYYVGIPHNAGRVPQSSATWICSFYHSHIAAIKAIKYVRQYLTDGPRRVGKAGLPLRDVGPATIPWASSMGSPEGGHEGQAAAVIDNTPLGPPGRRRYFLRSGAGMTTSAFGRYAG